MVMLWYVIVGLIILTISCYLFVIDEIHSILLSIRFLCKSHACWLSSAASAVCGKNVRAPFGSEVDRVQDESVTLNSFGSHATYGLSSYLGN